MKRTALCLSLMTALSVSGLLPSAQAKVTSPNNAPIAEIVDEKIGNKTFAVSRMTVNARPEHVWAVLTDYSNAPEVFENLKKCEVLEDKGNSKVVRHVIHPSGFPGTFDYTIEIKEVAPKMMEWHRIRGAFKEVDGYWKLESVNGGRGTHVTYSAYINGGFFLPQPLIREQIRDDIPGVMSALKTKAERAATQQIARQVDSGRSRND